MFANGRKTITVRREWPTPGNSFGGGNGQGRGGGGGKRGGRGGRNGNLATFPKYKCHSEQLEVLLEKLTPGTAIAIDCEGQNLWAYSGPARSGCGRVSVVTEDGTDFSAMYSNNNLTTVGRQWSTKINMGSGGNGGGKREGWNGGGGGGRSNRRWAPQYRCRAEQLKVRLDLLEPGTAVAIDCEGQDLHTFIGSALKGCGRVSVVTEDGTVIYDTFVYYPPEYQGRPPPQWLKMGVKYKDIEPRYGAQPIAEVVRVIEMIFDLAGPVVSHSIKNEKLMLSDVNWDKYELRDTQMLDEYRKLNGGRDVKLSVLAKEFLKIDDLQTAEHSSIRDAQATMELYLKRRTEIDRTQGNFHSSSAGSESLGTIYTTSGSSTGGNQGQQYETSSTAASTYATDYTDMSSQFQKFAPQSAIASTTNPDLDRLTAIHATHATHTALGSTSNAYDNLSVGYHPIPTHPVLVSSMNTQPTKLATSRYRAPGNKVAVPSIAEFANGRKWDPLNSVFY